MLRCIDPGEAMLACVDVIEAMQGPFEPQSLKRNVCRLLNHHHPVVDSSMQLQHELFRTQAAYTLLGKYFTQVDKQWTANPL
ncbi:hypothetical protein [Hymenobacter glacieicola]|nr:hypothetical protein [Hymenobacter glacieicola]